MHDHQPSGSSQPLPDTVPPAPRTSGHVAPATLSAAEGSPRYTLGEFLGKGGWGVVYCARDNKLERTVALKFLKDPEDLPPEALARFQTEARAVACLDHPHVIKIFDVGDRLALPGLPASPFLALEYVPGGSLAKALEEGKLRGPNGVKESAHLIAILARAMHHAHKRGIVHRDLKPDNVLCAEPSDVAALNTVVGCPKITDFGLARQIAAEQRWTLTGVALGTPAYMAPEQAECQKDVGPAVDTWALGVMLYECLTGELPFRSPSLQKLLNAICTAEPTPLRRNGGKVPEELERICLDCLAKEPGSRPAAKELLHRLARFLKGPTRQPEKEITNSIGMRLALIPPGTFRMGSDDEDAYGDEKPVHTVTITQAFRMSIHPVTQKQYRLVMGKNPSWFSATGGGKAKVPASTDDFPVETVSHEDAEEFCRRLSEVPDEKKAGRVYRLPTEAEWEYACRAGTKTKYHFGDAINPTLANFYDSKLGRTTKVGSYGANAFGLFDMHGNVWEWCLDSMRTYNGEDIKDPYGSKPDRRVLRGSSWNDDARDCRAACRGGLDSDGRVSNFGFRVVVAPRTP